MDKNFKDNKDLLESIAKWLEEKNIKFKFIEETEELFPTFIIKQEKVEWNIIIYTNSNTIRFEICNNDVDNMHYTSMNLINVNSVIYGLNVGLNVYHSMLTYNTCIKFEDFISTLN